MRTYSTLIVGLIAGSASGKMNDTKMKVKIRKQKATIRKLRAKLKAKNVELKGFKNADVGIDEEVSASLINESPEEACVRRGGHTGNLALLGAFASSCDNMAYGRHDPTAGTFSCENEDGSDHILTLSPGVDLNLKEACPEKCGIPCGHAPAVDIDDAAAANWGNSRNCAAVRDDGFCESNMQANWFCGESCRGGGPWDECMFNIWPYVESAREQVDRWCEDYHMGYGYGDAATCVDVVAVDYIADSTGTCPADRTGEDCFFDTDLVDMGSTQVNQCESSSMVGGAGAL